MFLKPFRVKSNSQVKRSDRKKLRVQLAATFPTLTPEACIELIPAKDEVSVSCLVTHAGDTVLCYLSTRQPVLLELSGRLLPTVYTLWRHPDLLFTFSTHCSVVSKLRGGADLMLPGVIVREGLWGATAFGRLDKGQPVAVNTELNRAPVAVGWAARDSQDLYMAGGRGKAAIVVHVLGDLLWEMGSRRAPPELGPPAAQHQDSALLTDQARQGSAPLDLAAPAPVAAADDRWPVKETLSVQELRVEDVADDLAAAPPELELAQPARMDDLLYDAFRQAWRTSARRLELPVLVSNFYAQHMQPSSPQLLDVKKSSYKKISKFLDRMQHDGLVEVKELTKGVQSIVSVQLEHPEVRSYRVQQICRDDSPEQENCADTSRSRAIERIEELYIVSGNTVSLYKELNIARGTPMSAQEVRQQLTKYVRNNGLQDENKTLVRLDPTLASSLTDKSDGDVAVLSWPQLHQRCLQRMSPGHLIQFRGEPPLVKKGAVPSIELTTATRSGNKKITMVLNLPVFGIDPGEFAHRCQVGVAASTSIGEAPNRPARTSQVMVQGNQIRFIGQLLQEGYKVPKKYIKGLDKAKK